MEKKIKMYLTPAIEVVEMDEESVLCSSAFVEEFEDGGVIDWFE